MLHYKKICWLLLGIVFFTSTGSQGCRECECPDYSRIDFAEIIGVGETNTLVANSLGQVLYPSDTLIEKSDYRGFNIEYAASLLDSVWLNPNAVVLDPSHCDCALERIQIAKTYPISVKVFTKYKMNDLLPSNSNVTDYFIINLYPSIPFQVINKHIEIDTLSLLSSQNATSIYSPLFEIRFGLETMHITTDSSQFIIETTLNTGQLLISETPLVRFK
jgi:hypothetical protein